MKTSNNNSRTCLQPPSPGEGSPRLALATPPPAESGERFALLGQLQNGFRNRLLLPLPLFFRFALRLTQLSRSWISTLDPFLFSCYQDELGVLQSLLGAGLRDHGWRALLWPPATGNHRAPGTHSPLTRPSLLGPCDLASRLAACVGRAVPALYPRLSRPVDMHCAGTPWGLPREVVGGGWLRMWRSQRQALPQGNGGERKPGCVLSAPELSLLPSAREPQALAELSTLAHEQQHISARKTARRAFAGGFGHGQPGPRAGTSRHTAGGGTFPGPLFSARKSPGSKCSVPARQRKLLQEVTGQEKDRETFPVLTTRPKHTTVSTGSMAWPFPGPTSQGPRLGKSRDSLCWEVFARRRVCEGTFTFGVGVTECAPSPKAPFGARVGAGGGGRASGSPRSSRPADGPHLLTRPAFAPRTAAARPACALVSGSWF